MFENFFDEIENVLKEEKQKGGGADFRKLRRKEKIEDLKVIENLNLQLIINRRIPR